MAEVFAHKRGDIYTVYVDDRMSPAKLGSYDDQPAGYYPQTYTSKRELELAWPNAQFKFLEPPKPRNTVITEDPSIEAELAITVGKEHTAAPAPAKAKVVPAPALGAADSINAFLKKLELARSYASKKNQKVLDIKIEAIKELLAEIFSV